MQITGLFSFHFGHSLYSGQAAQCSRITPPGHGLDATSGKEHAEAGQEYAEMEHKHAEAEHKYNPQGVQSVSRLVVFVLCLCVFVTSNIYGERLDPLHSAMGHGAV